MTKTSIILGFIGLAMMLAAVIPWPSGPSGLASEGDIEETATPSAMSEAERGRALFVSRGCIGCHRHAAVTGADPMFQGTDGAPNLTDYDPNPEFVRAWLRDPKAIRPNTVMPNLGLSESELDALIAFLSAPPGG